jgi:hypothetical protein
MSAESSAHWFAAIVVGLMVGVVFGIAGWLVCSRWDAGLLGLIVGLGFGDVAGMLVFRALRRPQ